MYVYFKIDRSLSDLYFLRIIYFILTYMYVSCCCFCQSTYVVQGYMNGVLNDIQTHLCSQPTQVSLSFIRCPIPMALCYICSLMKATA